MSELEILTGTAGLAVAALIIYLIRRDRMHARYSIWWFGIALATAILGFFPRILDSAGSAIGVAYPPVLALIGGVLALLVKILYADLERSRLRRELLRLTQRLLIVEQRVTEIGRGSGTAEGGNAVFSAHKDTRHGRVREN